ncbi:nucleoside triphosphate pyrophosphatase [Alcaligenaceae bacterium A4P071]|nr:nucleoside triphosphate pyrophosphatase [Alcaligenaceae bacterium A4P071]
MLPDTSSPKLYLASTSPRRRELLQTMHIAFTVLDVPAPPGEDEPQHAGESAHDYVCRTAREKAERGRDWVTAQGLARLPVLGSDTTVILDGDVLGKPADDAEAQRMLARLSGRTHEVETAVALWVPDRDAVWEVVATTAVTFRTLDAGDIARYCASGEPFGKAGAYGIQGLAGAFVSYLSGTFTGVMGLPVFETAQLLARADIRA